MTVRIGVLVNPIAGFGGTRALHGTDELPAEHYEKALAEGRASGRMLRALRRFDASDAGLEWVAAPDTLGSDVLAQANVAHSAVSVGCAIMSRTTRDDTIAAARALEHAGVDVIIFSGGDGTATDIAAAIGEAVPCVGVPSGVKMHSEVFARSPEGAGRMLADFVERRAPVVRAEVLDASHEPAGVGVCGTLRVPQTREPLQGPKTVVRPADAETARQFLARSVVRTTELTSTWVIGPGMTAGAAAEELGFSPSLRGVDVRHSDGTVERDVTEERLYAIATFADTTVLVLGVVGGQGFLLGRGNQELSPRVLAAIGAEHVRIVATEDKVAALFPPVLLVDSDEGASHPLLGYRRIQTGARQSTVMKVVDAAT